MQKHPRSIEEPYDEAVAARPKYPEQTRMYGQPSIPTGAAGAFSDFALTSAYLKLLAQEGYVTIRAAPRVMAKDGEKATISISRETYFSTQPINTGNNGFVFQQNLEKIDAGITLDITPVVRGDTGLGR
ncbi:MAG: hypothetical protein ACKV2Q_01440 [Planctomycetaceae bacterium]